MPTEREKNVIWKWRIAQPVSSCVIHLPKHHRFVHAGMDAGDFSSGMSDGRPMPAVWVELDPQAEKTRKIELVLVATGQEKSRSGDNRIRGSHRRGRLR